MSGKQAKTITKEMLNRMLAHVAPSHLGRRDQVVVLLSARAGLRACEIAGLKWSMVLDADGKIDAVISVVDSIAKRNGGRRIPMHRDLSRALERLRETSQASGFVIASHRGDGMKPNSIVNLFGTLFKELGYEGCSSHSGRRTFITSAARSVARTGGSLRDVQILAGHQSIETTQAYIDGDSDAQRKIVALLS